MIGSVGIVSCGGDDAEVVSGDAPESESVPTGASSSAGNSTTQVPISEPPPTTEPGDASEVALSTRPVEPLSVESVSLTWETPDGDVWPIEVIHPVDSVSSGWPVLVTFHPSVTGTGVRDFSAVASDGVVVVAPRWITPEWSETNLEAVSAEEYVDGRWFDVAACAFAAAQSVATDYGGDPERTTVEGFSAGVHPAAWVGLGAVRDDLCPRSRPSVRSGWSWAMLNGYSRARSGMKHSWTVPLAPPTRSTGT